MASDWKRGRTSGRKEGLQELTIEIEDAASVCKFYGGVCWVQPPPIVQVERGVRE